MDIRWEEPPPKKRSGRIQRLMAELQQHSGRWAVFSEYKSPKCAQANVCMYRKRYGDRYEIVARDNKIYARYLGELPSSET